MLFADGHICLQSRGIECQHSVCTEIWVICCLCIHQLPFQSCKAPCYHKIFILAFLMKSGFTLSGVVVTAFETILSLMSLLSWCWHSDLGYKSLLCLWTPLNLLALVTVPKKDTWRGIQDSLDHSYGSQPHQNAPQSILQEAELQNNFFSSSSSKSLRESNLGGSF